MSSFSTACQGLLVCTHESPVLIPVSLSFTPGQKMYGAAVASHNISRSVRGTTGASAAAVLLLYIIFYSVAIDRYLLQSMNAVAADILN